MALTRPRRIVLARLVLAFALLVGPFATCAPASAQGWFGNLFGGGSPMPRPGAPAYPGYGGGGGYAPRGGGYGGGGALSDEDYYRPRPRRHVQKKVAPPVEDAKQDKPTPKNASLFVYVFGDSLGQMLADGLDDALSDRDDVAVVHDAKGSSGLVNTDFYDWPKAINELLGGKKAAEAGKGTDKVAEGKPDGDRSGKPSTAKPSTAKPSADKPDATKPPKIDVAVMMIGSNDRQAIHQDGKTLAFGTDEWEAAYAKRVTAIDEAFRAHGIPLIWVGVPITKDDGFADAMASLNDITKEAADKTGATYVDTWEAFSDDNGDFSSYGPDINGQTVRLRSSDGIHFTAAGARKLAHFVDAHVRRALDGKTPVPVLPTDAPASGGAAKPVAAAKPDAGPIRNLNELPDAKNGTLAALPGPTDAAKKDPLATTTLVRGEAVPIPAGRADSARWPPQGSPDP